MDVWHRNGDGGWGPNHIWLRQDDPDVAISPWHVGGHLSRITAASGHAVGCGSPGFSRPELSSRGGRCLHHAWLDVVLAPYGASPALRLHRVRGGVVIARYTNGR